MVSFLSSCKTYLWMCWIRVITATQKWVSFSAWEFQVSDEPTLVHNLSYWRFIMVVLLFKAHTGSVLKVAKPFSK